MSHIPLTHNRVCAANGLICPDNRKKRSWRLWLFGVRAGTRFLCHWEHRPALMMSFCLFKCCNKQFRRICRYRRLRNAGLMSSKLCYATTRTWKCFIPVTESRGSATCRQPEMLLIVQYLPRLVALQHLQGKDSCPREMQTLLTSVPNAEHTQLCTETGKPQLEPFLPPLVPLALGLAPTPASLVTVAPCFTPQLQCRKVQKGAPTP